MANDAIYDARSICMREYATAPEVTVYGDPAFTFPYVPSHLHHMTFELVRRALSALPLLPCLAPAPCIPPRILLIWRVFAMFCNCRMRLWSGA